MATTYHNLHRRLEEMFYRLIVAAAIVPNEQVYRLADAVATDVELVEPFIGIACTSSSPFEEDFGPGSGLGNRRCELVIRIQTSAIASQAEELSGTVRDTHDELVGRVMDLFFRTDIVAILNALEVPRIGIDQIFGPQQTTEPKENAFQDLLTFRVECHPNAA